MRKSLRHAGRLWQVSRSAAIAGVMALWVAVPLAAAADLPLPLAAQAKPVRHLERTAILAVTRAGDRVVAVGERGVVLLSDDGGVKWTQAQVPVSVTLTAVCFVDGKKGWAVGHGGVVLHTVDGGATWSKQIDGAALARIALTSAQQSAGSDERALRQAQQLVADGADKPLLDVSFATDSTGVVVGAYGLAFTTHDGGKTWESLLGRIDNSDGRHLNAVQVRGNAVTIAGEQGLLLHSTDGSQRFVRVKAPYPGSLFALAFLPQGGIAVGGIKGNVFLGDADLREWRKAELPIPAGVTALRADADGALLIGTQAGTVYRLAAGSNAVSEWVGKKMPMLTSLVRTNDDALVLGSLAGIARSDPGNKGSGK